jgi:hypothetical protein
MSCDCLGSQLEPPMLLPHPISSLQPTWGSLSRSAESQPAATVQQRDHRRTGQTPADAQRYSIVRSKNHHDLVNKSREKSPQRSGPICSLFFPHASANDFISTQQPSQLFWHSFFVSALHNWTPATPLVQQHTDTHKYPCTFPQLPGRCRGARDRHNSPCHLSYQPSRCQRRQHGSPDGAHTRPWARRRPIPGRRSRSPRCRRCTRRVTPSP